MRAHGPRIDVQQSHFEEIVMKRLGFVLAVLAVAACSKGEPKADTTPPAMAPTPAPATADTGMKMGMDSATMKAKADSAHKDSVAKKLIKP
jgi:hypothetical protein